MDFVEEANSLKPHHRETDGAVFCVRGKCYLYLQLITYIRKHTNKKLGQEYYGIN